MVLIVDDTPENLFSLKKTLESHSLEADIAGSGEEALKKMLKNTYDLIILDVQMPGMDGYEVAETLAGYNKARNIPILFLSAVNKDKKFITRGYASGAIDYITKPVDPDILLLKVKNFIRLSRQTAELQQAQAQLRAEIEIRKKAQADLDSLVQNLEQKVTDRTQELTEANIKLEASNHDLQQFASVASHDLKEPLRKIQMFASIVKEKSLVTDEEVNSYLTRISASAGRMEQLIHDLLNFSRLSVETAFLPTDLNSVIANILEDLEVQIREKSAVFELSELPVIDGIKGQLRQVFQNLISNAIKFSRKDTAPYIRITGARIVAKDFDAIRHPEGQWCLISVQDNGIGFQEQYLDRIFTIFQRLHSQEQYEGTGIGLAITRKIIDRHQGLITATSEVGKGSTFCLILPLHQHEPA
jgi:light-regulated signal transduction histidine kinase (bacteriophytochrome)